MARVGFDFPESEPMTLESLLPPRRIAAVIALALTGIAGGGELVLGADQPEAVLCVRRAIAGAPERIA